jgi:hypothetical protein
MTAYLLLKIYDKDDFILIDVSITGIFSRHHSEDFLSVRNVQH